MRATPCCGCPQSRLRLRDGILSSTLAPLFAAPAAPAPSGFLPLAIASLIAAALGGFLVYFFIVRRHEQNRGGLRGKLADSHEREAELRRVIDTMPFPAALVDADGRISHLNRTFVETFGYSIAEIPHLDAWWPKAYPDPAYRHDVVDTWCRRLVSAQPGETFPSHETRVTCRDGSQRVIEWRSTYVSPHTLIVATDLTERLRASEALRASERRYRLLLEHSPEAIVVLDATSGRFVDCNASAEALFQYPCPELLKLGFLDISPATQPGGQPSGNILAHHIAEARAGRTPVFEWTHCDRTGREFACEVRFLRLLDPDGRDVIRGSIVDISLRKRNEDILRESEERFRLLIENSTELVAQVDRNGTFIYASPNHFTITGHTTEELLGRNVFEFIHPDDAPQVREALHSIEEQPTRVFRFCFKDGTWHWLESAGRRFQTSSGIEMAAVISRDITPRVESEDARKKLENQLRQSQKMEAIGTLAGGIAHDFNNILTGLFGNIHLARDQLPPTHSAQTFLAAAYKACERARDLVGKILTFSRRHEQQKQIHSLGTLVREAAGLLRASLPTTIDIRVQEAVPDLNIRCDPGQIHQVIMNLGANAAHAMRDRGGVLNLAVDDSRPEATTLLTRPQLALGRIARLSVTDTGTGMDSATRDRIFEPFFTTKPIGEGTGLGLAVVHGIVEEHGGAIAVESAPGIGTTVHVWFPVAAAPTETVPTPPQPTPRGRGERILFVDDEPAVTEIASRILRGLGYVVTAFTRSTEALAEFQRSPSAYALLLTDLTMPELTGPDLAERARRLRPDLPVLIATGYLRAVDLERANAAGFRHFLEKPFSVDVLAQAVRRAIDEKPERAAMAS